MKHTDRLNGSRPSFRLSAATSAVTVVVCGLVVRAGEAAGTPLGGNNHLSSHYPICPAQFCLQKVNCAEMESHCCWVYLAMFYQAQSLLLSLFPAHEEAAQTLSFQLMPQSDIYRDQIIVEHSTVFSGERHPKSLQQLMLALKKLRR